MTTLLSVMLGGLFAVATLYSAFWAIYVLALPLLAWLRRNRGRRPVLQDRELETPRVVVIVPAHEMAELIERCIGAVRASRLPSEALAVYVVADHCQDDTAARAAAAGATVLMRSEGPPGKTYAISWALATLADRGITADLYVVTDATARVAPDFLASLVDYWRRGEDIIVGHSVVDMENQQWFAQCLGLTLVHRNLQNAARERLRLSALIEGRGMAYSSRYVRRHGWTLALPTAVAAGTHPTEDWRHGVRAVEHGYRVSFADEAVVVTPLRGTLAAATRQGVRWEQGRMANAGTHALTLLRRAVARRNRLMIFAAMDAVQPPVAILAAASVAVAAIGLLLSDWWPTLAKVSALPVVLIGIYGIGVVSRGRRDGIRARTVLWAPIYVLWRSYAFCLAAFETLRARSTRILTP
jgi:cellulose synthase/poly-beta-1,6-N-acetylglucosamine synthase-like glycosyltransferase